MHINDVGAEAIIDRLNREHEEPTNGGLGFRVTRYGDIYGVAWRYDLPTCHTCGERLHYTDRAYWVDGEWNIQTQCGCGTISVPQTTTEIDLSDIGTFNDASIMVARVLAAMNDDTEHEPTQQSGGIIKEGREWLARELADAAELVLRDHVMFRTDTELVTGYLRGVRDTARVLAGDKDPREVSPDFRAAYERYLDEQDPVGE